MWEKVSLVVHESEQMVKAAKSMFEASIVLLTFNGEKYLAQLLDMVGKQKLQPVSVFAIDSGSTDSTLSILKNYNIAVEEIPQTDFSHSRTRNLAARMCSTEYLVFLTQDATPADSCWLECLLAPFHDIPNIAGTFSRQVARPGADLLEANDVRILFPARSTVKSLLPGGNIEKKEILNLIRYSNSSSAYNLKVLLENPFDERMDIVEDQEWAKRMLERGLTIVYAAPSVVLHSHHHSLQQKYSRSLQMGRAFSSFMKRNLGPRSITRELGAWLNHLFLDAKFITGSKITLWNKFKWLALSPVHRAITHYAYRKGWNTGLEIFKT